jgi:peptidoglycan lytic transglycosylase
MRGVTGALPLSTRTLSWVVAAAALLVVVLAGLDMVDHLSRIDTTPRSAALPPEPSQTSNRVKKAARETVQARLTPSLAQPAKPEISAGKDTAAKPETGRASWYDLSTKTASGEAMDGEALTAAHNSLPLGSQVRVENLDNGRVVVVRINDRGPFAKDRIIDLSKAAAARLGMIADGVANVRLSPVEAVAANAKAR